MFLAPEECKLLTDGRRAGGSKSFASLTKRLGARHDLWTVRPHLAVFWNEVDVVCGGRFGSPFREALRAARVEILAKGPGEVGELEELKGAKTERAQPAIATAQTPGIEERARSCCMADGISLGRRRLLGRVANVNAAAEALRPSWDEAR